MEIWKSIKDFKGLYEISNLGRVRSLDRTTETTMINSKIQHKRFYKSQIISQHTAKNGYLQVVIFKQCDKKTYNKMIHRLVAEAFISNPENKQTINHKNSNKLDNRLYNLEWNTMQENNIHAINNDLRNIKKVKCIELQLIFISSFKAAEFINNKIYANKKRVEWIAKGIRRVARKKQYTAYGYRWKYID